MSRPVPRQHAPRVDAQRAVATANYLNDAICLANGYYVSPCPVGSVVVGYYRYYNVDGWFNGWFTYQNTSTNSPWNTLVTSMYIL